ncbi:MAG: clan AA aspartic protease [Planctomycetes bacterium]|nr:clan AA aspartic protease [Planctomycetota bacterium]
MMTGRVAGAREAVVPLQVRALGGRPEWVQAVVDTGFTEFLALSSDTIERLGLPFRGNLPLTLADGSEDDFAIYRAIVEWHGYACPVSVAAIQAGALLGMGLLRGSRLTLDITEDGPVQIEPLE